MPIWGPELWKSFRTPVWKRLKTLKDSLFQFECFGHSKTSTWMFLNVCVCFMETLSSLYRYVENEWDRKKTQDLCTRSTFNNCCSFCCLFVSLFSFFKSLKIALLENFSRFFWHLPADKQTRDFCLARSNVCAFIYLVELSVHCVLLFVGFWLACMVWAVSSPVALAGFFFFFFVLFFFFF